MNKEMKFVKLSVNQEERKILVEAIEMPKEKGDFLQFAYEQIGCDRIDVVVLGDVYSENHFTLTVDDEGLLNSGSAVLEVSLPIDGKIQKVQLAGTIIIGHSSQDMDEIGLTQEQVNYIYENLKVEVIGFTR